MSSCIPIKDNISIYEADDCSLEFVSSLGDITGYTIKLQARIETSSRYAIIDVDGTVAAGTTGKYTVTFPSQSTLGKAGSKPYYYDIKLTAPDGKVHTDRYGMMDIDPRTTDLDTQPVITTSGVDIKKDGATVLSDAESIDFKGAQISVVKSGSGVEVSATSTLEVESDGSKLGDISKLNFVGTNLKATPKGDTLDLSVDEADMPVTIGAHFVGFYPDLKSLQDAIAAPGNNYQAIVLSPSEEYYHGVGGSWVELAPVGSIHPQYLGVYDTVQDLQTANPSPSEEDLAIVGTSDPEFYYYANTAWKEMKSTDLPALSHRMEVAEQHLQTLQSDTAAIKATADKAASDVGNVYAPDKATFDSKVDERLAKPEQDIAALKLTTASHTQELSGMDDDIRQLQGQVFTGIHLEDTDGNAFDDINGIVFEGAEVQDDQGTQTSHVVIKPKITVANGQTPTSTSKAGNALIFPGAVVTADPNDLNVLTVDIPSADDGINVGDGANASREVKTILFNGHQAFGSGDTAEIHLEFAHFKTMAERDTWTSKFSSHMDFDLIALVDADENGFVAYYRFDAATKTWKDYDAQGVVMSDSNGAIPKNIKTVVFGPGFAIQQAGDQEDAALVTYAESSTGTDLSINQDWGNNASSNEVTAIQALFPLEVNQNQIGDTPLTGNAALSIKPNVYEPAHSPALLTKVGSLTEVKDGHDTVVYYNSPITPYGMYFSASDKLQGINIQEDDDLDPNLGGQLTELLVSIGFEGGAPKSGTVKLWLMYHQNGAFLPNGYVIDSRGKPLIVEKSFAAGEQMKIIIDGAYYAQGQEAITVHVEHDFSGEYLIVDPEESLFCVNQYQYHTGSSLARVEFLRRNETQITPAFFNFDGNFVRLASFLNGTNEPETEVDIGEGENFIAQFGVTNLTKVKASVTNGVLSVSDNGNDIADFYIDYLVDNVRTQMMRGKTFTVDLRSNSIDTGFNLALYSWSGKADEPEKIYSSRNNMEPVLNAAWTLVSKVFMQEDISGGLKSTSGEFTIPDGAVNVSFALVPVESQMPLSITIEDFDIAPKSPFIGYVSIEKRDLRTVHLDTRDDYLELGQNSEGYASLRYTLNYSPISGLPMPVGEPLKGKAPFTLDKSKNVIGGSSATGGEGALVAGQSGQVSLSCDYLLWNEQNTDNVVTIWWVLYDADGNESKIADSQIEFTIPKKTTTHGIIKTQPAFLFEIEKGQAFALRASANKADGAYLESTRATDYMVRPVIDFKELQVSDAGDDPWADIDFTQFEDVYTNSVTVTKVFHSAASAMVNDLPAGALVFAKAAFKHMADGSIRPVAKLDQSYKGGILTVSFGETADVMVILEINL
ncbi:hypothetical protein VPHK394_0012 [Vibrio phage K394]